MAEGDGSVTKPGKATTGANESRDEFEDFMSDLEGFMHEDKESAAHVKAVPKPPASAPSSLKVPVAPPRPGPPSGKIAPAAPARLAPSDLALGSLAAPKVPKEAAGLAESLPPLPVADEPLPPRHESQRPTLVPREEVISRLVAELHEPEPEPSFGKDPLVAFPKSNRDKRMDDVPTVPPPNLQPAELDAAALKQEEALLAEANLRNPPPPPAFPAVAAPPVATPPETPPAMVAPVAAAAAQVDNEAGAQTTAPASFPTIPPGMRPRRSGRTLLALLIICAAAAGVAWLVFQPRAMLAPTHLPPTVRADNPPPAHPVVIPPVIIPPGMFTATATPPPQAAAAAGPAAPAASPPSVQTASATTAGASAPPPTPRKARRPNAEDNPY